MESSPINSNPPSSNAAAAAVTLSPRAASPSGRPGPVASSPWTQIVRGPESESIGAPADISLAENPPDSGDNCGGNAGGGGGKKPAWNKKPSNGSVDSGPGSVVIGGAASWPALSESTKASPKPSPSADSGSPSPPPPPPPIQVTGLVSSSSSPLPSPSQSSLTSQKPTSSNANHYPTSNHGRPARQKSTKRDGSGGGNVSLQANGGFSHQPGEGLNSHSSSVKTSSSGGNESSGRDNVQNHGNRESGPRNAGGDHHQPRSSFRRGNGGPHSRGDGSHQNYGGRRGGDQDRGNHDWNHQRSFNGRDAPPMQSRAGPRGFVRTPPVSAPFVHHAGPVPMRPFINPMGMPDMHMIYFPPAVPFVAPLHPPMFFPAPDPQLLAKIVNQIDYYFSNENLIKDTFLRRNMDQNGWVPVTLIASFKKVTQLTDNIQLILEAVRSSSVVEAQGDKIRRRDDWMRWIMPPSVQFPTTSSLQSPESPTVATLSADIRGVSLNERTTDVKAEVLLQSSSGNLSSSLPTNNDGAASSGC